MQRSRLAVAVLVLALASSAAALAGNGYRVRVSDAQTRVASGHEFTVMPHGLAAAKAHLYLYLDRKPCQSTWASEARRINSSTFRPGQSYFRPKGGSKREAFTTLWVTGQYDKAFVAFAGTTAELEYACGYLTRPNSRGAYKITAAVGSAKYTVTP